MHLHDASRLSLAALFCLPLVASTNVLQARQSNSTDTKGDRKCFDSMCVSATVNGSNTDYVLSATTSNVGWMAVGFGTGMVGSPMVIMWQNGDGTITLSQRQASDHVMPQVVSSPPRTATLLQAQSTTSGNPSYAFSIPSDSSTNVDLIWAFSPTKPSSASADATIVQHSVEGTSSLDLSKSSSGGSSDPDSGSGSGGSSSGSDSRDMVQRYVVAHALICVLGFLFFLPFGALLARYTRTMTNSWFKGHWISQVVFAGPLVITGFALGVRSVQLTGGNHLDDKHKKWGVAIFVLYFVQILLGAVIHFTKPVSGVRPPQNYAHAVIGILIVAFSLYQVRTGYTQEWQLVSSNPVGNGANIVWYIWVVLLPVLYFAGLAFLPKQFRQEKDGRSGKQ